MFCVNKAVFDRRSKTAQRIFGTPLLSQCTGKVVMRGGIIGSDFQERPAFLLRIGQVTTKKRDLKFTLEPRVVLPQFRPVKDARWFGFAISGLSDQDGDESKG